MEGRGRDGKGGEESPAPQDGREQIFDRLPRRRRRRHWVSQVGARQQPLTLAARRGGWAAQVRATPPFNSVCASVRRGARQRLFLVAQETWRRQKKGTSRRGAWRKAPARGTRVDVALASQVRGNFPLRRRRPRSSEARLPARCTAQRVPRCSPRRLFCPVSRVVVPGLRRGLPCSSGLRWPLRQSQEVRSCARARSRRGRAPVVAGRWQRVLAIVSRTRPTAHRRARFLGFTPIEKATWGSAHEARLRVRRWSAAAIECDAEWPERV